MKARIQKNIVGPQVRRKRCEKDWSQEKLADELQDIGWNAGRKRVAKIENGEAKVSDIEQLMLAAVFSVGIQDLLPRMNGAKKSLFIVLQRLTGGVKTLMSPDEILASKSLKLLNGNGHNGNGHNGNGNKMNGNGSCSGDDFEI